MLARIDAALPPLVVLGAVPGDDAERSQREDLLTALSVRRNAAIGSAVGLVVAVLAAAMRLLEPFGPAPTRGPPALFLVLALVLAIAVAALVTVGLSAVGAYRLTRRPPE